MALTTKSLFLFGFEVSAENCYVDFKNASLGSEITATLTFGYYTLDALCTEVARAMNAADPLNTYICTANRTYSGGTQNRVTISTNGAFLSLLFATGTHYAASVGSLLGFSAANRTGNTSYVSNTSAGTALSPELVGYTYLSPEMHRKVQGAVNISASGEKEAIVFAVMKFMQVEFKFEPHAKVLIEWVPLVDWLIAQKPIEFTPSIAAPTEFFSGTLESTAADGKGLAWKWVEQLPEFPFYYRTGIMTFREKVL